MSSEPTRFFFDFISPYSYLATRLIAERPALRTLSFDYRPVVLGTILSKRGVKGPGEEPVRRSHGLKDVLLLAEYYGIPLIGPPVHPFNPLYALRLVTFVADRNRRELLVRDLFDQAWANGGSLEDLSLLRACLSRLGIDADPEEIATSPSARLALKESTEEAIALGVFGVPSFESKGILFFGHDRLDLLLAHLSGAVRLDPARYEDLAGRRPAGVSKRGEP